MFHPFTLIQGPPGTGKTVTVVRLTALYVFVNEKLDSRYRKNNIKPQVMICGPSNKSVDVIAGRISQYCRNNLSTKSLTISLLVRATGIHRSSYTVLHWLPMPQRIQFKIAFLAINCLRGAGPLCLQHVRVPTVNVSGRAGLRSAKRGDLTVLRTATELGGQGVSVATPCFSGRLEQ